MPAFSTIAILGTLAYGAYSASKAGKVKPPPPLPPPEPAAGPPKTGEADATTKHKMIKGGRQGDILTGSLAPPKVGKKRLLGGVEK